MRKYILLIFTTCLLAFFTSGCSFFNNSSNTEATALEDNTDLSEFNSLSSDDQYTNDVNSSELPNTKSEKTDTKINNNISGTGNTTRSGNASSSDNDTSSDTREMKGTLDIQTAQGYVLSCDENTIYVDLKNTGSRLYPGEGENRKVAFDISNAEQVQTNISEFNPPRSNFVQPGIQVNIEYYVEDGINIVVKLTSDGDEKEPYNPVAIGKVITVSDTELSIVVTEGDNVGENIIFNLSECNQIIDDISVGDQVAIAYYTNQDINYAVYIGAYIN